ncbi:hypothetical protein [Sediminibacterium sp.]|uniref:hypothetical protein n=1 Tax=Sediminibacterium sp. TaxID=1917865 RepID=UPI002731C74E|nr:hypothetical protein [Sediminibacterium sp.]MDP2421331.1 hypothetical protein [Sediminibacterium sp.]
METEEIAQHPCRYCEKEIPHWRRNKVFCGETCKYNFHNAKRSMAEESFGDYHRMIKRNYEILNNALGENRYVEIPELHLKNSGFGFDFCTFAMGSYRYCYDLSYRLADHQKKIYAITVVSNERQEEMNQAIKNAFRSFR